VRWHLPKLQFDTALGRKKRHIHLLTTLVREALLDVLPSVALFLIDVVLDQFLQYLAGSLMYGRCRVGYGGKTLQSSPLISCSR
jgi:hypothetical protein